jgi:hypothetical protein
MEKEFNVTRLTNGMGHSHLVVITEPAIEDVHIGTVVIVPYAEGFKEPSKVLLQVDEKGLPKRANGKFAIVSKYIVVLLILLSGCASSKPSKHNGSVDDRLRQRNETVKH